MTTRSFSKQEGFTLIETMIAGGLLLVLSSMVVVWLTGGLDLWWTTSTQSDVRRTAQQVLARMGSELRNATRTSIALPSPNLVIPAPPNNTSLTFCLPTDLDGNGLIVDAAGNIEWDLANPIQYLYVPALRQLHRIQGGTVVVLAHDVQSVQFHDQSTNPALLLNDVQMTMTLQHTTPQQRTLSSTSTAIVTLRN